MSTARIAKTAFKGMGRNKVRTFLMMLGVVIGIVALTLVVSAAMGAQKRIMERVRKFGLDSLMVTAGGGQEMGRPSSGLPTTTLKIEDAQALKDEIRSVVDVAPFNRRSQSEIKFEEKSTTTGVFGVTPSWEPVWDWEAKKGEFITEDDMDDMARSAVIGETPRRELFGDDDPIGETVRIGTVPFEIKGIMQDKGTSPGGGDMDNRIYVPLSTFLRRVANVDYLWGIKIRLKSVNDIDQAAEAVAALLRERHKIAPGLPDDFTVRKPDEVKEMAENVAGTFNLFLIVVAGISLISGGVVVSNIMLISVNERRKEIGLRKAVGAGRRQILLQFLLESTVVTLAGGMIGFLLGAAGARLMQAVTKLPTSLSWQSAVLGIAFSAAVGLIAGLQPARRAAALEPVEALRS
ncbi:MAG: ABC transporter permease [Candidatus Aminicenantes bacterium]|nr:ABC transporter permease [Candidatus Aminicenantes bacterium]